MEFGFSAGVWAFGSFVVLLIIYLIRPRPKDVTIPSLMFIIKDTGKAIKSSFLEKLLKNLIFLLQLLALAALAFAIMGPIINIGYDSAAANTIIILDASASMGAHDRFDQAVDIAKSSMKGEVSIVLAEEFPVLMLNNGNSAKAKSILASVKPKDVGTNLGDAMLLAKDLLDGEEGRIIVLSDFAYTSGPDPDVVKKILQADGAVVDFVNIGHKGSNVGIIDLLVSKYYSEAYLKNYGTEAKDVTVSLINNDEEIKKLSMTLEPGSANSFSFETPGGQTEININEKDDLEADNHAYISAPEKTKINILLVTNDLNTYLKKALESSAEINLQVAEPPIIPKFDDFDIIILGHFNDNKILTGTFEELLKLAKKGKSIIITGNDVMNEPHYKGLIPVSFNQRIDQTSNRIYPYAEARSDKYSFAEEQTLEFGTTNQYWDVTAENGSVVYAMTGDNIPIIVTAKRGEGNVVYYGIIDKMATFKSTTSYPVFWNELVHSLMGSEDISGYNYPTGKIVMLGAETKVITPEESMKTNRLLLDGAGFYTYNGKTIAANLLNEVESDINLETNFDTIAHQVYDTEKIQKRKDVNIENYLILLVLAAILAELFIIKYRGDL